MNPQLGMFNYTNTNKDQTFNKSKALSYSTATGNSSSSQVKNLKSNIINSSQTIRDLINQSSYTSKYLNNKRIEGKEEEDMDDTLVEDILEKEGQRLLSKLTQGIIKTSDNNFIIHSSKILDLKMPIEKEKKEKKEIILKSEECKEDISNIPKKKIKNKSIDLDNNKGFSRTKTMGQMSQDTQPKIMNQQNHSKISQMEQINKIFDSPKSNDSSNKEEVFQQKIQKLEKKLTKKKKTQHLKPMDVMESIDTQLKKERNAMKTNKSFKGITNTNSSIKRYQTTHNFYNKDSSVTSLTNSVLSGGNEKDLMTSFERKKTIKKSESKVSKRTTTSKGSKITKTSYASGDIKKKGKSKKKSKDKIISKLGKEKEIKTKTEKKISTLYETSSTNSAIKSQRSNNTNYYENNSAYGNQSNFNKSINSFRKSSGHPHLMSNHLSNVNPKLVKNLKPDIHEEDYGYKMKISQLDYKQFTKANKKDNKEFHKTFYTNTQSNINYNMNENPYTTKNSINSTLRNINQINECYFSKNSKGNSIQSPKGNSSFRTKHSNNSKKSLLHKKKNPTDIMTLIKNTYK
ncbi:MAG: hypothetical protein MJ252_01215 [archaeon]|nr:hypothetical protein [archaeon]